MDRVEVRCIKGTREKFMIVKDEIYLAKDDGSKYLLVECEDGIERDFLKSRFRKIKWREIKY